MSFATHVVVVMAVATALIAVWLYVPWLAFRVGNATYRTGEGLYYSPLVLMHILLNVAAGALPIAVVLVAIVGNGAAASDYLGYWMRIFLPFALAGTVMAFFRNLHLRRLAKESTPDELSRWRPRSSTQRVQWLVFGLAIVGTFLWAGKPPVVYSPEYSRYSDEYYSFLYPSDWEQTEETFGDPEVEFYGWGIASVFRTGDESVQEAEATLEMFGAATGERELNRRTLSIEGAEAALVQETESDPGSSIFPQHVEPSRGFRLLVEADPYVYRFEVWTSPENFEYARDALWKVVTSFRVK